MMNAMKETLLEGLPRLGLSLDETQVDLTDLVPAPKTEEAAQ